MFQWSKDYTGAAFYFDEAGFSFQMETHHILKKKKKVKGYKAEQKFDKAIITLTKNVEVNEKLHEFPIFPIILYKNKNKTLK